MGATWFLATSCRAWLFLGLMLAAVATTLFPDTAAAGRTSAIATIGQAYASVEIDGKSSFGSVALPYHWDRLHPGHQGKASFIAEFRLDRIDAGPYAIYSPKVGNAFAIWINDKLLVQDGDMEVFGTDDYAKVPRLFVVPREMLASTNTLRIDIRADTGRRSGLGQVWVGPMQQLREQYSTDYRLRGIGTLLVSAFSLLLAGVALSIWVTQRIPQIDGSVRRDPMYLYAALAEIAWTLRVGDALVESPPLPWELWSGLTVLALTTWNYFMVSFCVEVMGWGGQLWVRRLRIALLVVAVLAWPCGSLAVVTGTPWLLTACYLAQLALSGSFIVYMAWKALRGTGLDRKLVSTASLVNLLVGVFDLVAFRLSETFAQNTYMRYSSVLFGLALGYTLIRRFQDASRTAHVLTRDLTRQVEIKETELRQSYLRLEKLAREQEREAERARVLRDLHDGVGAQISLAMRQIEVGTASQDEVLRTLRESMDFLKLSIDSMAISAGDIAGLLANFRYRVEPRLNASRIQFVWDVGLLDDRPDLDDLAMRHLLFILYEAISNVLQHSGATMLTLRARQDSSALTIFVEDNGQGISEHIPHSDKLKTMKERATLVGASLTVTSTPTGTCISVHWS